MPTDNLTDPVAPDLSSPTKPTPTPPAFNEDELMAKIREFSAPTPTAPQSGEQATPTPVTTPTPTPPVTPTTPVAPIAPPPPSVTPPQPVSAMPMPATLPAEATKGGPNIITIILLLLTISAGAASFFFFMQSRDLGNKLKTIQQTLDKQQLTPTPTPTDEITPTPTVIEVTATPTPTESTQSGTVSVFNDLAKVITIAQGKYPDAQLLTIFVENAHNPTLTSVKYWFRQNKTEKKYIYVKTESGAEPVTYDLDILTPDNNIPSLNTMGINGQLGIDLAKAIKVAASVCPSNFDCTNSSIDAQFIKANTTLWQITFKYNNRPFIVQVDSITEGVLYKSNI